MTEKILGYILLGLGIMTTIYSGLNVYAVFTKQTQPVKLFNFKGIGLDTSQMLASSLPPEAAPFLKQNPDKPAPSEIISAELINDTSNIFAHLMLMGFIASVGAKLANIGAMLVRPIVVKLKAKEVVSDTK